jgi:hypothetical protein
MLTEEELKQCRICLDDTDSKYLIHPCLCKGSSEYVHISCLETWRSKTTNINNVYHCNECQYPYKFSHMKYMKILQNEWTISCITVFIITFISYIIYMVITSLSSKQLKIPTLYDFYDSNCFDLIMQSLSFIGFSTKVYNYITRITENILQRIGNRILNIHEKNN